MSVSLNAPLWTRRGGVRESQRICEQSAVPIEWRESVGYGKKWRNIWYND